MTLGILSFPPPQKKTLFLQTFSYNGSLYTFWDLITEIREKRLRIKSKLVLEVQKVNVPINADY